MAILRGHDCPASSPVYSPAVSTTSGGPSREVDPSGGRFPSTRWTLVARAGGSDPHATPAAIAELVRLYSPALRGHLLHAAGGDAHQAEDLLQGFLADKVLEQRLIGFADPGRGRFRSFLLTALDRYVIDEHRRATARKRRPDRPVEDIAAHAEAMPDTAARSAFDRAWAQQVVAEVLAVMRRECEQANRHDLWDVFEVRYLRPAVDGVPPEPHESIAARLKLESAHQAGNLLTTAKRMFTRVFKTAVARYAADESELRDEVAELWRLFATRKA